MRISVGRSKKRKGAPESALAEVSPSCVKVAMVSVGNNVEKEAVKGLDTDRGKFRAVN